MVSNSQDIHRLTLRVQRLMDADLLPSAEGNALLAEIEALAQIPGEVVVMAESGKDDSHAQTGDALVQAERRDTSTQRIDVVGESFSVAQ